MNRRSFLRRVAAGTVGAAAVAILPASAFVTPAQKLAARQACRARLLALYRAFHAEHGLTKEPIFIVGREFFQGYEDELLACERFIPAGPSGRPRLMFKGSTVIDDAATAPWNARVAIAGTMGGIVRETEPLWRARA